MGLTLYDIIKHIINESVSGEEVLDAIHNKKYVRIKYDDGKPAMKGVDKGNPKGSRVILPMAYGTTKAGNPVVRAFQWNGNSRRGAPKWKFFRLDRITSWKPFRKQYSAPPDVNPLFLFKASTNVPGLKSSPTIEVSTLDLAICIAIDVTKHPISPNVSPDEPIGVLDHLGSDCIHCM